MTRQRWSTRWRAVAVGGLAVGLVALSPGVAGAAGATFFGAHHTVTTLSTTVPANEDQNPYGVAVVPASVGRLHQGDILVSNFNNKGNPPNGNLQGTGTTIVQIPPGGIPAHAAAPVFATVTLPAGQQCPGGVGLTTALAVFPSGWVIVGSVPTTDGMSDTINRGCLIILNAFGQVVRTIHGGLINGPWDMVTAQVGGDAVLFVSNVLNGITQTTPEDSPVNEGTVVRVVLDLSGPVPQVDSETVVASGFAEETDPSALVIGPTGLGLSQGDGLLYVADTLGNQVTAVPAPLLLNAPVLGKGLTVSAGGHLMEPLGLTVAPNGDILTVNSGDGNAVEISAGGAQTTLGVDTSGQGAGTLFGLALSLDGSRLYLVDDGNNTLTLVK